MAVPIRGTPWRARLSARSDQLGLASWSCRAPSRDGNTKLGITLRRLVQQPDGARARTAKQRIDWSHTRGGVPCAQFLEPAGLGILPARDSATDSGSDADRGPDNTGYSPGICISGTDLLP